MVNSGAKAPPNSSSPISPSAPWWSRLVKRADGRERLDHPDGSDADADHLTALSFRTRAATVRERSAAQPRKITRVETWRRVR